MKRARHPSRRALVACVALGAMASPSVSWALLQSCTVAATSLPFGPYNPSNVTALNGTGVVTVTCTVTLLGLLESWEVRLSSGGALSYSPRKMANGAARMNYNIYTTAARTTVWGDGSGSTGVIADTVLLFVGNNVNTYTMYGRIPALQDLKAGAYTDSIVVTVLY